MPLKSSPYKLCEVHVSKVLSTNFEVPLTKFSFGKFSSRLSVRSDHRPVSLEGSLEGVRDNQVISEVSTLLIQQLSRVMSDRMRLPF